MNHSYPCLHLVCPVHFRPASLSRSRRHRQTAGPRLLAKYFRQHYTFDAIFAVGSRHDASVR